MDLNRKQETFHESPQKHSSQSTYPRWLWPVPPASWAPWRSSVPGEGHWPQMAEKRRERYPLAFQYLFKIKHNWLKTNNCFITLQRRKGLVTFPLVLVMKTRQELPDIPIVQWCVMSVKIFLTVRRPRFEAWRISELQQLLIDRQQNSAIIYPSITETLYRRWDLDSEVLRTTDTHRKEAPGLGTSYSLCSQSRQVRNVTVMLRSTLCLTGDQPLPAVLFSK